MELSLKKCLISSRSYPSAVQYFSGSKFYENERKKEEQMKKRIEEQKVKIEKITDKQLQQGIIEVQYIMI